MLIEIIGEKGEGKTTQKPLHYKATVIHRVVKDFMVQGGDFSAGIWFWALFNQLRFFSLDFIP